MRLYRDLFLRLSNTRWFSWLSIKVLVPIDRLVYSRSGGRFSLLHFGRGRTALPTLLLTTTGRKSKQPRTTPVLYLEDGGRLIVVASNFGQLSHPQWSENLLADPSASVLVQAQRRSVTARLASDEEKAALWPRLIDVYPAWTVYTTRTDRDFRAFVLESS